MNEYALTQGSKIYYGDAGQTSTYVQLAGIDSIDGLPSVEADETEISRVDQDDMVKQFAATMEDPGTLEITLAFVDANVQTVYEIRRQLKAWKVELSTGAMFQFEGWIKKVGPKMEADGEVLVPISVRVSGAVTPTAAP